MSITALGPDEIARRLYHTDRLHQALPSPEALTDEHLEEYQRTGLLAIEGVFTPQEIEAAKAGLSHLIAWGDPKVVHLEEAAKGREVVPEQRWKYVRKVWKFVEHEPRLKAMCEHPKLLEIVRRLVGGEVRMFQDMALLKPPFVGREKPWHQDTAYFKLRPLELICGTWTALDVATKENGCMRVIPGSHLGGARPHYHDRDCQMADEDVRADQAVAVPLRPGGVMFFSGLLHHGTPPNHSPQRRRALQFHYASVNCTSMEPEEHGNYFHDDQGYAGCAVHSQKRYISPNK